MELKHSMVFVRAAEKFDCEIRILVPNELSGKFIGQRLYKPKPLWCKAKTADCREHAAGGLVADPEKCPGAFSSARIQDAKTQWKKFLVLLKDRIGFRLNLVEGHPLYGCVLFHGNYLYSDYDLLSILPFAKSSEAPKVKVLTPKDHFRSQEMRYHPKVRNLSDADLRESPFADYTTELERKVRDFVLPRTGVDLIQHGAAINHPDGKAGPCYIFNPVAGYVAPKQNN